MIRSQDGDVVRRGYMSIVNVFIDGVLRQSVGWEGGGGRGGKEILTELLKLWLERRSRSHLVGGIGVEW